MEWPTIIGGRDTEPLLFHGADLVNVPAILRYGLAPRSPRYHPRYKGILGSWDWGQYRDMEPERAVFLTPKFWAAARRDVVLQVDVQGLVLIRPVVYATVCSLTPIPAARIVEVLDRAGTVTWKRA